MLSMFEQISNNRLVKSIGKSLRNSTAYQKAESVMRFAKSTNKLKSADARIVAGLKGMGLITRDEARVLERRIVQLEARLNVLEHGPEIRAKASKAATAKQAKAASKRTVAKAARSEGESRPSIRDSEASA